MSQLRREEKGERRKELYRNIIIIPPISKLRLQFNLNDFSA
jgi:hypothetical protein